ncbi:MAG: hypothetical protein ACI9YH_005028, partial [Colwellia sp.]|jgi:hypothetical protein
MTIDSDYELPSSGNSDFNNNDSSSEFDNNIADFDLDASSTDGSTPKQNNKRNYLAKKKIEQLKEERQLRKLFDDDYDDWD